MTAQKTVDKVLITGATRGIGLACASLLHERGHEIVGLARSADCPAFPGELFAVNLSDREATQACLDKLQRRFSWSGLVNNVGAVGAELIEDINLSTLDQVLQVNLGAAILCAQLCIPSMRRLGAGRIINISSELALGLPKRTAYGAAKAGLISITRTWALELARDNITVNAVAPGAVETEFFLTNNPQGSSERKRKHDRIPLGRFGQPHDIAAVVAFLMSEDAAYITGQTIHVDGGSTLASAALF